MKIIYARGQVKICSLFGEIEGSSLLHYLVAKILWDQGSNHKDITTKTERIIQFDLEAEVEEFTDAIKSLPKKRFT